MSHFQHLAVSQRSGPHVTLVAGVAMAGRSWSTTSSAAAKVGAIRSDPRAAVLEIDAGDGRQDLSWTLLAGRATVLDPRRPRCGLVDPVAASLAGVALARIGLAHADQVLGYLRDATAVPTQWHLGSRVLIVVQARHRLMWESGGISRATGAFAAASPLPPPTRRRGRRLAAGVISAMGVEHADLVQRPGPCALGLSCATGAAVVPATWHPDTGTVSVDRSVLAHLGAVLPGRCSVTFDQSSDPRPAAKLGVMLRGRAERIVDRARTADAMARDLADLTVAVDRVTTWDGFASTARSA